LIFFLVDPHRDHVLLDLLLGSLDLLRDHGLLDLLPVLGLSTMQNG
jgi:hypothetical protein